MKNKIDQFRQNLNNHDFIRTHLKFDRNIVNHKLR